MEVVDGVCVLCNSGAGTLTRIYSKRYFTTISRIFTNKVKGLEKLKSTFQLCPVCIFKTDLINAGKKSSGSVGKSCRFCCKKENLLELKDVEDFKKLEPFNVKHSKVPYLVCPHCYFLSDSYIKMKEQLEKLATQIQETNENEQKKKSHHSSLSKKLDIVPVLNHKPLSSLKSKIRYNNKLTKDIKLFSKVPFVRLSQLNMDDFNKNKSKLGAIKKKMLRKKVLQSSVHNGNNKRNKHIGRNVIKIKISKIAKEQPIKNLRIRKQQKLKKLKAVKQGAKTENSRTEEQPETIKNTKRRTPKKNKKVHFDETPTIIEDIKPSSSKDDFIQSEPEKEQINGIDQAEHPTNGDEEASEERIADDELNDAESENIKILTSTLITSEEPIRGPDCIETVRVDNESSDDSSKSSNDTPTLEPENVQDDSVQSEEESIVCLDQDNSNDEFIRNNQDLQTIDVDRNEKDKSKELMSEIFSLIDSDSVDNIHQAAMETTPIDDGSEGPKDDSYKRPLPEILEAIEEEGMEIDLVI